MKNQVKVIAHPETGKVLTINPDNGWGTFRVDSEQRVIENGIFRKAKRTAFISVAPDQVENFDLVKGETLPGIIQKQRSNEPMWENHSQAINPQTQEEMGYYLNFEYISDINAPSVILVQNETEAVEEQASVGETV